MIKSKIIWLQFSEDDIEPAPFANVFESDIAGNIISGGFYAETDASGSMQYDDQMPIINITAQWQGNKITLPFYQFNKLQNIVIEVNDEFEGVVITADKTKNDFLIAALLFITAKSIQ